MKVHVLSDLHLEFWQDALSFELARVDADVLVLAGDIHLHTHGLHWAADVQRQFDRPVIYVPGNHEFYHSHLQGLAEQMRKVAGELGVHLLDNDELVLDGVRFLGTTLWTDFRLRGSAHLSETLHLAKRNMADFGCTRFGNTGLMTPAQSAKLHATATAWLDARLSDKFDGPTVVVTHHCPHPNSIAAKYRSDALTPAFCSDLRGLIGRHEPTLWVHGHTHSAFDYYEGATRIVCNPGGYPHESFGGFDPAKVVIV